MNAYVSASVSRMSDGGDGGVGHKSRGRGFYDRGSNADPSNADIDFSSNHRRNRSVPKRSQPLRFSSTECESSIGLQNKTRESRYSSCAPIRKGTSVSIIRKVCLIFAAYRRADSGWYLRGSDYIGVEENQTRGNKFCFSLC